MTAKNDLKTTAWIKLMRASTGALQQIEDALKAAKLPPLLQYDILLELTRVGDEGLRLYELEARLLLKQYGVSRVIDRMTSAGLVQKIKSPEDGRGYRVTITADGQDIRRAMWDIYRPALEAAVGAKLSDEDARQLVLILDKLL